MQIKACIFDLGNTLMAIPDQHDEEICISKILGYKNTEEIRSIIYRLCDKFPGQSTDEFLQRFDNIVNPSHNEGLSDQIKDAWMKSVQNAYLKPYALEILEELKEAKIKLALISNTPPTSNYILDNLRLRKKFDEIVFSCDVKCLKPNPKIFKIALDKLDVDPKESIVIGDKIRTDILGGAILGMRSVLVEERLRCTIENKQNYVDAIIPQLADFKNTKLFKEITQ